MPEQTLDGLLLARFGFSRLEVPEQALDGIPLDLGLHGSEDRILTNIRNIMCYIFIDICIDRRS